MFRTIRIVTLLTILVVVAGNQWLTQDRFSSWDKPLWVTIYPVLAEADASIQPYVEKLDASDFNDISSLFKREARRYGRDIDRPMMFQVAQPLASQPPDLPTQSSGFKVAVWSLRMRWWAWRHGQEEGLAPADIKMFVRYQTQKPNVLLERSVGVQKGSYGVVNAVASNRVAASNRIVIAHELMHILGASDKYDLSTGQPTVPEGLANPTKIPLFPQSRAEIMAGRIAVSVNRWVQPANLSACVIGKLSASEIGWINAPG